MAGSASVSEAGQARWISTWLRNFEQQAEADSFDGFCDQLVTALQALPGPRDTNVFQCATWVMAPDDDGNQRAVPQVSEVSNETGEFVWRNMLPDDFVQDILAWRAGDREMGYPIRFVSSGIPKGFAP